MSGASFHSFQLRHFSKFGDLIYFGDVRFCTGDGKTRCGSKLAETKMIAGLIIAKGIQKVMRTMVSPFTPGRDSFAFSWAFTLTTCALGPCCPFASDHMFAFRRTVSLTGASLIS